MVLIDFESDEVWLTYCCLFELACSYLCNDHSPSLTKVHGRAEQWYHYNWSFTVSKVVLFIFL